MTEPIWALVNLRVSTPTLTLQHVSDELADELARLAAGGIHDPGTMPFSEPWTDVAPPLLERNCLQYFWRCRAEATADHWDLPLAVVADGRTVGVCTVHALDFPARRSVTTGSWLGRRYQGVGIGREMRAAALHLVFAGFDADEATTRAWHDNAASLAVTASLPYARAGTSEELRRGQPDTMLCFSMTRQSWKSVRRNDIRVHGMGPVAEQLCTGRDGGERSRG